MPLLAIETSCDETAVAIYDSEQGLLSHQLYSQIDLHQQYGGVVPELASRDHIRKLAPLVKAALAEAGCAAQAIEAVGYTAGPGLIGALLVGANFARALAFAWQVPAVAVHHLEAHLLAPMLESEAPEFPFLALLVSGGHSMLVLVQEFGQYQILGETLDDAAGEAFDKTAKLIGLPYPGGPHIAKCAEQGDSSAYRFPRPMTDRPGLDFSFSGLKTFVLNTWLASDKTAQTRANIARCFQDAVVDTLLIKCRRAIKQTGVKRLVVAGGVGANKALRQSLAELMAGQQGKVYYPRPEFCTDNAAMVAYAAECRFRRGLYGDNAEIRARWPLDELSVL